MVLFIGLSSLYYLNVDKLKYMYLPKPKELQMTGDTDDKLRLASFIRQLQELLGLNYKYRNLFRKDGSKIELIQDMQ